MTITTRPSGKTLIFVLAAVGIVAFVVALVASSLRGNKAVASAAAEAAKSVRLVPGSNTLELSPQLINTLGVRTVQVQSAASHERLTLSGVLNFDSNRMVRVHSRFPGEVVSIGNFQPDRGRQGRDAPPAGGRSGDQRSTAGSDLEQGSRREKERSGERALSSYSARRPASKAQASRKRGRSPASRYARPSATWNKTSSKSIGVERTLRSWRLTEAEINVVRAEAEKIHSGRRQLRHGGGSKLGRGRSPLPVRRHRAGKEHRGRRHRRHESRPVQDRRPERAGRDGQRL